MTTHSRSEWYVRTPRGFLDSRVCSLRKPQKALLQILESHARDKPYCKVTTDELAKQYDCTLRHMQAMLSDLEQAEVIHRHVGGRKTVRFGIILRCRVDPDRPVADDPASLQDALRSLDSTFEIAPSRARKIAPSRARKIAPSGREKSRPPYIGVKDSSKDREKETLRSLALGEVETDRPSAEQIAQWESQSHLTGGLGVIARMQLRFLRESNEPAPAPITPDQPEVLPPSLKRHVSSVDDPVDTVTMHHRLGKDHFDQSSLVDALAERLATAFNDQKSIGYYRTTLREMSHGDIPVQVGIEAFKTGWSKRGDNPGMGWGSVIKKWRKGWESQGGGEPGKEKPAVASPLRRSPRPAPNRVANLTPVYHEPQTHATVSSRDGTKSCEFLCQYTRKDSNLQPSVPKTDALSN